MKLCKDCGLEKEPSGFYPHATNADRLTGRCRECWRVYRAAYRQRNLERVRAHDRERSKTPERMALRAVITSNYYDRFPNRQKANDALNNAIKRGLVLRQPCWVCGAKAQAHHPDYDRPLDVVWLCPLHHKQAHALVANEPQMKEIA